MHIRNKWSGGINNDEHRQGSGGHGFRRFSASPRFTMELRKRQTCCGLPVRLFGSKIPARRFYSTIPREDKDHRQLHTANIHELSSAGMVDEQSLRISWPRLLDRCQSVDFTLGGKGDGKLTSLGWALGVCIRSIPEEASGKLSLPRKGSGYIYIPT